MANVDGKWNTVAKSPMGDQQATLSVTSNGDSFTGDYSGMMGSIAINDGRVDGDTLTWSLDITIPMPLRLTCQATIDGDTLTGTVTAGAFGSFPLTGQRA